jgi:hypothetical protein
MRTVLRKIKEILKPHKNGDGLQKSLSPIETYLANGQKPWTTGYWQYKDAFINRTLSDADILTMFRQNQQLPAGYGFHLDERAIEYPWVFSRLENKTTRLIDAGGTLVFPFLLRLPILQSKSIVVCTLGPENWMVQRPNVSYIYGDLRQTILREAIFDEIVCISTLDHIGMDNTFMYTVDNKYRESNLDDYLLVITELKRLLVPQGRFLFTVPFGRRENHGWMQQFGQDEVNRAIDVFGGEVKDAGYYRYEPEGWQKASAVECSDCQYFDIHHSKEYGPDYAAAARAVACLELVNQ